jgi:hypothetical protein
MAHPDTLGPVVAEPCSIGSASASPQCWCNSGADGRTDCLTLAGHTSTMPLLDTYSPVHSTPSSQPRTHLPPLEPPLWPPLALHWRMHIANF